MMMHNKEARHEDLLVTLQRNMMKELNPTTDFQQKKRMMMQLHTMYALGQHGKHCATKHLGKEKKKRKRSP
jgi:hypothetical protein